MWGRCLGESNEVDKGALLVFAGAATGDGVVVFGGMVTLRFSFLGGSVIVGIVGFVVVTRGESVGAGDTSTRE